jgi:hypothetical protein
MVNVQFHRYAVVVATSALMLIAIGAYLTSQASGAQTASRGMINAVVHRDAAVVVVILAIGLAVWQAQADEGHLLGWAAAGLLLADGWAGWLGRPLLHASLAPLAFSVLVTIAILTSSLWAEVPELVDGGAAPLLRPLAIATPPLVLLQTVLGAAYRHKLIGVIPHLGGAMIVSFAALIAAMLVIQRYPGHRALGFAANWLISIVLAQVVLGVTAFAMQLLEVKNTIAVIVATASHVVVGSLTLSASLVLAMQVQRNVRHARLAERA